MRCRLFCAALLVMVLPLPGFAADLAKLRGPLLKQPAYQSAAPGYVLLVFGKKAEHKVWLVFDGKTLHADLNGNGDLTEPGEVMSTSSGSGSSFVVKAPSLSKPGGTDDLYCAPDYRDPNCYRLRLRRGRELQFVGFGLMPRLALAKSPQTAPVVRFDGPLTLARYGAAVTPSRTASEYSRAGSLRLVIGTPGLGTGAFVSHHYRCAKDLGPLVGEFVYRDAAGQPIRIKHELKQSG